MLNPHSAGIVYIRQNLTSVDKADPRVEGIKIFIMTADP